MARTSRAGSRSARARAGHAHRPGTAQRRARAGIACAWVGVLAAGLCACGGGTAASDASGLDLGGGLVMAPDGAIVLVQTDASASVPEAARQP